MNKKQYLKLLKQQNDMISKFTIWMLTRKRKLKGGKKKKWKK